jgi:hypothetical protein
MNLVHGLTYALSGIINMLYMTKILELALDFKWVTKNGKSYADEFFIKKSGIKTTSKWKELWLKLNEKYKRSNYLLSYYLDKIIEKGKMGLSYKTARFIKLHIFRGVRLLIFQSILIPIIISQNCVMKPYLIFCIILMTTGIILQASILLMNNLKMGFVNNYHLSIFSSLDKDNVPIYTLSVRSLLKYFLEVFGRNFASIIIGFAGIYSALYFLNGSFRNIESHSAFFRWAEFIYFSIASISTTGYGDISALNVLNKLFCSLEIIIGLLFITILVLAFSTTHSPEKSDFIHILEDDSKN